MDKTIASRRMLFIHRVLSKPASPPRLLDTVHIECMCTALDALGEDTYNGIRLARHLLRTGNLSAASWEYPIDQAASAERTAVRALKRATRRLPKLQYEVQKYTEALAQAKKVRAEKRIETFTRRLAIETNALEVCKLELAEATQAVRVARVRTAVIAKIASKDREGPAKVVGAVYSLLAPDKAEEYIDTQIQNIYNTNMEYPHGTERTA